jgi:NADPH:quinone reductase-like Zn-dependent oxidoreductase
LRVTGLVPGMRVARSVYGTREIHRRGLDGVFQLARQGRLTIPISKTFALARAAEAVRLLQSRRSTGKLLLIT